MIRDVVIRPSQGMFDKASLGRRLMDQFDAVEDPLGSNVIMLVGFANWVSITREDRLNKPDRFPFCALVDIEQSYIRIEQEFADVFSLHSCLRFLTWVFESQQFGIFDYGKDRTSELQPEGLYPIYDQKTFAAAAGVAKPALVDTLVLSLQRLPPNYVFVDYDRPELGYMAGFGPDDYLEDEETAAVSLDFDAAVIQTRLLQQFDSLADPCGSATVLLAGLPTAVAALRAARVADPQQWPNCPRVDISAATIRIEQQHGDVHQIMSCVRFLVWVMEQIGDDRVCRIEDGNGNDLTAQWSTPAGVATFYDPRLWE